MPQVPYNPVPNAPNLVETPKVHVESPAAAFGGSVGEALSGLGRTLGHAGDELFQRALALQNLRNETEAKEADAQYMMEVGKLHANYSSLQGKAAVDALPKYQEDIQNLRQQMRGNLSNDMARKMFDGSSLSTMGRTIFNGAGHAATENKKWAHGASIARVDAAINAGAQDYDDELLAKRNEKLIETEVRTQGDIEGSSEEKIQEQIDRKKSSALSHRITGMARSAPWQAWNLFKESDDKHLIHYTERDRVEATVLDKMRTVGARNLASDVDASMPEASIEDKVAKGRDLAKNLIKGDPSLSSTVDYVEKAIIGLDNQKDAIEKKVLRDNRDVVVDAIQGNYSAKGIKPMNVDELIASDPKVAVAWDALPPPEKRKMRTHLAQNSHDVFVNTPERSNNYHQLIGLSGENQAAFLDYDILNENLTEQQKTSLLKMQRSVRLHPETDPRVGRAMDTLKPSLAALTLSKDETLQFRGALQLLLEDHIATHGGKQPNAEEVRKLGAGLLQQQAGPGTWWGTNKYPMFQVPISDDIIEQEKANPKYKEAGVPTPTDEQIKAAITRDRFNKLYGSKKEQGK